MANMNVLIHNLCLCEKNKNSTSYSLTKQEIKSVSIELYWDTRESLTEPNLFLLLFEEMRTAQKV